MAQSTRSCLTCGTIIHRTAPNGPLRGWCSADCRREQKKLYRQQREPIATSGTCVTCGATVPRIGKTGIVRSWCSDECRLLRRKRTRKEQITTAAPCVTCRGPIQRVGSRGRIPKYCSDTCRPRCAVAACNEPQRSQDWCSGHYDQWRRTGDPLTPVTRIMTRGLICAVDGCGEERRKRKWCTDHYVVWRRHGVATAPVKRWPERADACLLCGSPTIHELRQYCSKACSQAVTRARAAGLDKPPTSISCQACGDPIDVSRQNGRAVGRANTLACRPCIRQYRKHGVSPKALAKEHGIACGICGQDVDLTLRYPDLMRGSIDHKLPVARGGTNDPSNLQLVHLRCNFRKGARFISL